MIAVAVILFAILAFCAWWYRAWDQKVTDADTAQQEYHVELCDLLVKLTAAVVALDRRVADLDEGDSRRHVVLRTDLNTLHNDLERIAVYTPELTPQTVRLP